MNTDTTPAAPPPIPPQPKKGLSKGCIIALVIAIVAIIGGFAILVVLGVVGGRITIEKARALQAKATMKGLEIAIKSYKTEYLRLPYSAAAAPSQDNQAYDSTDPNGMGLINLLLAIDTRQNPRQIRFWDPPPRKPTGAGYEASAGLNDPWGKQGYKLILDYDNDGKIADPEGISGNLTTDVLLYSAGPDGDFATWKDNVCSWK